MENPVWVTAATDENITLRMGDNAGGSYISIRDYANNEIGYINSDGYGSFRGLTLVGNLVHNVTDPVDPQDAATKNYVDTHTGANDDTMYPFLNGTRQYTGNVDMGSNQINNVSRLSMSVGDIRKSGDASVLTLAGGDGAGGNLPASIDIQGSGVLSGNISFYTPNGAFSTEEIFKAVAGNPTGYISAKSHIISNITDPVDPQDAATKNYVDGQTADTSGFFFVNGSRNITGYDVYFPYIGRLKTANNTGYLHLVGGETTNTGGGSITLQGADAASSGGYIVFRVPNAAKSSYKTPLYITGNTDTGEIVLADSVTIRRDVNSSGIYLAGGSGTTGGQGSYVIVIPF
jgi:hypothetical protein